MRLLLAIFLLSGCGYVSRMVTNITGELTYKCNKNGVEYVQSDSGLAVNLDQYGYPVINCKETK